jgi:hypothetical protein
VPIAVVGANAIVIHAGLKPTRRSRLLDPGVTPYVWLIGDLFAVAVVWLLGLSAVRAFTACCPSLSLQMLASLPVPTVGV